MPAYQLIIRPPAEKDFRALPKADQERIGRRIQLLADTPRPPGCTKLGDPSIFRVRQGDYRIGLMLPHRLQFEPAAGRFQRVCGTT